MAGTDPICFTHRNNGAKAAIVFIHGFGGQPEKTWGRFAHLLSENQQLQGWDLFSFGYPSTWWFDLTGLWKAEPPVESVADNLRTTCQLQPLSAYQSLTLIGHSMGGLVVQRALVDDPTFRQRVSNVILFGTPSNGLAKAAFFKFWKQSFNSMAEGGAFITDLRQRWRAQFDAPSTMCFTFRVVAGYQDEFVPRRSSLEPFLPTQRAAIPGDHLSIVHPQDPTHQGFQLVLTYLLGPAASQPVDAALVAVERQDFEATVARLGGSRHLDEHSLVALALALEGIGRADEAITRLEANLEPGYTDAMGVLAGRLKRRWYLRGERHDAERAYDLYRKAFVLANAAQVTHQAFYLGINVAFMERAWREDVQASRAMARRVLEYCQLELDQRDNPDRRWALATQGEAQLLLGETEPAIRSYRAALQETRSRHGRTTVRETLSMYQQATRLASILGDAALAERLDAVFRGTASA